MARTSALALLAAAAPLVALGFAPSLPRPPRPVARTPPPRSATIGGDAGRARRRRRFPSLGMAYAPAADLSDGTDASGKRNDGGEAVVAEAARGDEPSSPPRTHYDAVVVGGGPAGLLSAIMMARLPPLSTGSSDDDGGDGERGPKIAVYDRLPPVPPPDDVRYSTDVSRYYLLGLGHRGQRALRHFDAWDDVEKASVAVLGRRDWAPGKTREEDGNVRMANKSVTSRVLARDKLVGVLKWVIEERYPHMIELRYGWQVDPISFGNEEEEEGEGSGASGSGPPVRLQVSRCVPVSPAGAEDEGEECSVEDSTQPTIITTDFLIGADGAARTIANAMESNDRERRRKSNPLTRLFGKAKPFRVRRYEDDNPRVYKSVPIRFPSHWPHDLNYSARSTGSRVTFEALPSDGEGSYCALMLMRPNDELARAECDPEELRRFFDEEFPQFGKLLDRTVIKDVAKKGASSLPSFRFSGPRLHEGGRTVLLGDCIHTVKPYYGLGANTALEDVQILSDILSATPDLSNNLDEAVAKFTQRRASDSRALVTLSRGMDRPGKLGTMRFVLPLILDSTFNRIAPRIFAPSMFGMFQKEGMGFTRIQRRKRLDRAMQFLVIFGALSLAVAGLKRSSEVAVRMFGVKKTIAGLVAAIGTLGLARSVKSSKE